MPIDDGTANDVIAKLLFLEMQSKTKPITLYINSPGGSASAGIAILRTLEALQPKVCTHCVGQAHSMAAIVLAAGTHGCRSAGANATITFSRVEVGGDITPEKLMHVKRIERDLIDATARFTGMTKMQVGRLFVSSQSLSASEAI